MATVECGSGERLEVGEGARLLQRQVRCEFERSRCVEVTEELAERRVHVLLGRRVLRGFRGAARLHLLSERSRTGLAVGGQSVAVAARGGRSVRRRIAVARMLARCVSVGGLERSVERWCRHGFTSGHRR